MEVVAIVVAAGGGSRFGAAKQFASVGERSVVDRAVAEARQACDLVVVVVPPGSSWRPPAGVVAVAGGATRSESVRAGLAEIPTEATIVVVHDAARPLATSATFRAVVEAVAAGADAAVPALPVADTLKRVDGDVVVATVPRDDLVAVQTPQAFRAETLRAAHHEGGEATDDAALVEAIGGRVVVVPGDPRNLKLTVAEDLDVVRALLEVR